MLFFRQYLKNSAAKLRKNEEGVAAIEFAIIAPLMITMYFGLAEIASAISVDRRISHGANVAADLVTQNAQMTTDDIEEALAAAVRVMGVNNVSDVTIDIRSYVIDTNGAPQSEGVVQFNSGAATLKNLNVATLDTKILNENSGVVVTRVAYTYSPLKLRFFDTDITLNETFMLKPRRSNSVILAEDNGKNLACSGGTFTSINCT